jgi:DNA-binding transcriptional regulator YiaG
MTTADKALAATGLTVARLARLLGVSTSAIHYWRTGERLPTGGNRVILELLASGVLAPGDVANALGTTHTTN